MITMKKLSLLLVSLLAFGTITFAQEENKIEKIRPYPQSYEQRVERGFGQPKEVEYAGQKPEWMQNRAQRRYDMSRQVQLEVRTRDGKFQSRGPVMMRNQEHRGRGPMAMNRGEFRGGPRGPMMHRRGQEMQVCDQCQRHMQKRHFRGGPQGRQHRGGR
jgi:hypothetical protein